MTGATADNNEAGENNQKTIRFKLYIDNGKLTNFLSPYVNSIVLEGENTDLKYQITHHFIRWKK